MEKIKHALKFGVIGGFIMIAGWWPGQLLFLQKEGGTYDFFYLELFGYATMALALTTVFIGIKRHGDKELAGKISFKPAFVMGLYITFVASVIYVMGWMIYYPNFMPDFASQYAEHQMKGLSHDEVVRKQKEMQDWMRIYENPLAVVGITFMEIFPIGSVVALVSAFILSKKKK